nr:DNA repair exonuclease [uncultured Cohaesibacter sp.]
MRFIHAADFHLGKPFGQFDEETRVALRQARLDALRASGEAARLHDAPFVLIAGDTFDAEAPPSKLVKRALDVMVAEPSVTWVWMPGNHDSLAAADLWERIARDKPGNVILATDAAPLLIGDDAAILPAPPTVRSPGFDLTEWMGLAETGERIRIGLAHGGVTEFGSEDGGLAIIPPDRAERSELDYLALGDWHGQMRISDRCWYAGASEADSFKGHDAAGVLLVDVATRGAVPTVEPIPIGRYHWQRTEQTFFPGCDPVRILDDALPHEARDRALVRFVGTGRLGLSEHAALRKACEAVADDFHFFDFDLSRIGVEQSVEDLDVIAESGALRVAAESLLAETSLEGRTEQDARIAQTALSHLFHLAQEVGQ